MKIELKRNDLLEILMESISLEATVFIKKCESFIKQKYQFNSDLEIKKEIREKLRNFHVSARKKYEQHYRKRDRFLELESNWLDCIFINEDIFDQE